MARRRAGRPQLPGRRLSPRAKRPTRPYPARSGDTRSAPCGRLPRLGDEHHYSAVQIRPSTQKRSRSPGNRAFCFPEPPSPGTVNPAELSRWRGGRQVPSVNPGKGLVRGSGTLSASGQPYEARSRGFEAITRRNQTGPVNNRQDDFQTNNGSTLWRAICCCITSSGGRLSKRPAASNTLGKT